MEIKVWNLFNMDKKDIKNRKNNSIAVNKDIFIVHQKNT